MTERMLTGQELAGPQVRAMLEKQAEIRPSYRAQSYAKYVRWARTEGEALRERMRRAAEEHARLRDECERLLSEKQKAAQELQALEAQLQAKAGEVRTLADRYNALAGRYNAMWNDLQEMRNKILEETPKLVQAVRDQIVQKYGEKVARLYDGWLNEQYQKLLEDQLKTYDWLYNERLVPLGREVSGVLDAYNRALSEYNRLYAAHQSLYQRLNQLQAGIQARAQAMQAREQEYGLLSARYRAMEGFWRW
jgi:uncharacterized protein (DUF3084 family)